MIHYTRNEMEGDTLKYLDLKTNTVSQGKADFRSHGPAFFVVIIYIFDQLIISGLIRLCYFRNDENTQNLLFMKIADRFDKDLF